MVDIEYKIIRKSNLKQTYIVVKPDLTVEIKTALNTPEKLLLDFIREKSNWILKKQALFRDIPKLDKSQFYLFGMVYEKDSFGIKTDNDLYRFYREKTIETIEPILAHWSKIMSLFPSYVGYRRNRGRWGSCSAKNRVSFNTLLSCTPTEFIEYVVVHELCHIKHKNHSKLFYALLKSYLPDYKYRENLVKNRYYLRELTP